MKNNTLSKRAIFNVRDNAGLVIILLSVLLQSIGAVLSKYAALNMTTFSLANALTNQYYFASLGCMALQALIWQQALRQYELSFAYPFVSLINIFVLVLSFIFFKEAITIPNIVGAAIVTFGVFILMKETAK